MKIALFYLLLAAAVTLWLGSLLPIIPTDLWWVRVADFPRLQTSIGLVVVLIGFLFFTRRYRTPATTAATITAGVLGYQAFVLLPYLPTGTDLASDSCPVDHRFKIKKALPKFRRRHATIVRNMKSKTIAKGDHSGQRLG